MARSIHPPIRAGSAPLGGTDVDAPPDLDDAAELERVGLRDLRGLTPGTPVAAGCHTPDQLRGT
jgi:hypothetical protein